MALWPFRRKSARKRSRSGAALSDGEGPSPRSHADATMSRAVSKKKQRTEPAKLQRRQRRYSFSPGRNDSIRVDHHNYGPHEGSRPTGSAANASAEAPAWERTPTLHHKNGHPPTRRKSSKRRREDPDREAEIKAMSAMMPSRAGPEAWASGALTKQSSKRVKTTGSGGQWEKPTSNVSLPLADSLHSTRSSDSDFVSYKVSALDSLLAPRPTLRCAPGTRWTPSRASAPPAAGSQKKTFVEREGIPEEMLDSRRRIDDLADGLDASDLRELMERDNRRRERKRQSDQERMERRLARRAEKQRRADAEARKSGTPPPENLERGVIGRELIGLGIEPPSAVVTSSRRRESPAAESAAEAEAVQSKEPLQSFHRTDTIPVEESPAVEPEVPIVRTVPPPEADESVPELPQGSMLAGILGAKKSQSKSTLSSDKDRTFADDEFPRKDSESSNKAARLSFTSFLKWGGRNRRNSGPSSFSNTSREEMHASGTIQAQSQAQAEALARLQGDDLPTSGNYLSSKIGSVPKRTRSRFREDLPEFPLSPPDSRVQSPDAEPPLPIVNETKRPQTEKRLDDLASRTPPPSEPRPINGARQARTTADRIYDAQSPDPHQSMSLASIDSEGSWLSGRVGSRRTMRDSVARANRREHVLSASPDNSTEEDLTIADDDYLSRLEADRSSGIFATGCLSDEGRPSSDEDEPMQEDDVKWGAVGARHHVVQYHRYDRDTMRSREGLLNIDSGAEEDSEAPTSPISPVSNETVDLRRARSVNVGKGHARNFSAGSAKLLDIHPRVSLDGQGQSQERRKSSPLVV